MKSITEATVGRWFKKPGEAVKADEPLVELETDKVTVEVPAPAAGVLGDILAMQGATVAIGSLLAALNEGGGVSVAAPAPAAAPPPKAEAPAKPASAAKPAPAKSTSTASAPPPAPAARKVLAEAQIDPDAVAGSGRRGQVLKEDALAAVAAKKPALAQSPAQSPAPHAERRESPSTPVPVPIQELRVPTTMGEPGREERVKMSRLRQTIARRLKDAQNTAAMLTTFNDVDMSAVMALRSQYKDLFEKRHGVKLGFMGFFVKACVQALREIPAVNAEIDGEDIIYKNYYHIGVAVGTDRGLVVPVLREADRLSLAETEITIAEYRTQGARRQALDRRHAGRHVHDFQRRRLWVDVVDAHPECAAVGHFGYAPD